MMKRLPTTLALSALPALFLWMLVIVPLWSMLGYGEQPLWREIFTDAYYQHTYDKKEHNHGFYFT